MGKKDVDLVRAFGISAEMLQAMAALINEIKSQGGQTVDIRCLKKDDVRTEVAKVLVQAGKRYIRIVVDYNLTLEQMIASVNCDRINWCIDNFYLMSGGQFIQIQAVEVELWHPNRFFRNSEEVVAALAKDKPDYRFVTLPEFLALGTSKSKLDNLLPIGAFSPIYLVNGVRWFVYLRRCDEKCCLGIQWAGMEKFDVNWSFAVVRKVS